MDRSSDTASGPFSFRGSVEAAGAPDPALAPALYRGLIVARSMAFLADIVVLGGLFLIAALLFAFLGFFTLGLLWPGLGPIMTILFFGYFTVGLGGDRHATPGMRWQQVEMRTWDGHDPGYLQSFIQTLLYYVSVSVLTPLVLLVPLFNSRRRCLHDYLSGAVFVRRHPRNVNPS